VGLQDQGLKKGLGGGKIENEGLRGFGNNIPGVKRENNYDSGRSWSIFYERGIKATNK